MSHVCTQSTSATQILVLLQHFCNASTAVLHSVGERNQHSLNRVGSQPFIPWSKSSRGKMAPSSHPGRAPSPPDNSQSLRPRAFRLMTLCGDAKLSKSVSLEMRSTTNRQRFVQGTQVGFVFSDNSTSSTIADFDVVVLSWRYPSKPELQWIHIGQKSVASDFSKTEDGQRRGLEKSKASKNLRAEI